MKIAPAAFFQLAYYFVKRLLVRFFHAGRYSGGLEAFKQNYVAQERLAPVDLEEQRVLLQAARCTHCSKCDDVFSSNDTLSRLYASARPSHLPLWLGPQPGRYEALRPLVEALQTAGASQLDDACPEGLSFSAMMELVERKTVMPNG